MNPTQTDPCDGCACAIHRAKSYYLHFPDGTEEWFCNDCQSSLRQSYIQKADQRGFGFDARWDDEEEEEDSKTDRTDAEGMDSIHNGVCLSQVA